MLKCCYCDRVLTSQSSKTQHERSCVYGPIRERIAVILHENADGEYAPTKEEYNNLSRGTDLPSGTAIGNNQMPWSEFVESFGLKVPPKHRPHRRKPNRPSRQRPEHIVLAEIDEDLAKYQSVLDVSLSSDVLVHKPTQQKRIYNWRTRQYEWCYVAELK